MPPRPLASRLPPAVDVRVPASTSNLGAGFDTLGLALALHATVRLVRRDSPGVRPLGPGSAGGLAMVTEAARAFFGRAMVRPFGFSFRVSGGVPVSRGLGSSVTLRTGVVAGLNALSGAGMDRMEIAALVTRLEGHPDNATPAVLGGFCVGRTDPRSGALAGVVRKEVGRGLVFVVAVPSQRFETRRARAVLPRKIPHVDAVRSINSASFLTAVLLAGEHRLLPQAVADFMHEPYRLPLIPGAGDAIRAGVTAGALTGWLSGSGSSVLCVARPAQAAAVGRAMVRGFDQAGVRARALRLRADNRGLQVRLPRGGGRT